MRNNLSSFTLALLFFELNSSVQIKFKASMMRLHKLCNLNMCCNFMRKLNLSFARSEHYELNEFIVISKSLTIILL